MSISSRVDHSSWRLSRYEFNELVQQFQSSGYAWVAKERFTALKGLVAWLEASHCLMHQNGSIFYVIFYVVYNENYSLPQLCFSPAAFDSLPAIHEFLPRLQFTNVFEQDQDASNGWKSHRPLVSYNYIDDLQGMVYCVHPCDASSLMTSGRLDGLKGNTLKMFRRSAKYLVIAGSGPFDPYKILGISPSASKDEIKRAYHRLALRYHPDGGPEGNAERFSAVHEAYEAVKSGEWKPSPEQKQKSTQEDPHGWDPMMRMYVYEKPGSTTESYVSGHTETILRLCMLWCFCFIIVRVCLFWLFPNRARNDANEAGRGIDLNGSSRKHNTRDNNSTQEEEAEFQWALGMHQKTGVRQTEAEDPLARRN